MSADRAQSTGTAMSLMKQARDRSVTATVVSLTRPPTRKHSAAPPNPENAKQAPSPAATDNQHQPIRQPAAHQAARRPAQKRQTFEHFLPTGLLITVPVDLFEELGIPGGKEPPGKPNAE